MGNQTQNPGQNPNQNPGQKAPGQDDKTRRDTNQPNPSDPNRQRTPGAGDDDSRSQEADAGQVILVLASTEKPRHLPRLFVMG